MLKKAKENKKGFTLAELLIVVAIIAVLVAISIPIFTSQLEKSRDAVTLSNIRAAYAEASSAYLTESDGGTNVKYTAKTDSAAAYVVVNNVVVKGESGESTNFGDSQLPFSITENLSKKLDKKDTAGTINVKFTWAANGTCSADVAS
ncbi:putative major pilin subunit [uncultured Blautia sp.]|nr:prepilin-type N-terminal cleavage/methylation domain-containing protein [uncultured Blautia sp.]SCH52877.1 putative major pilin subunit [uncultured Blautia sp.]